MLGRRFRTKILSHETRTNFCASRQNRHQQSFVILSSTLNLVSQIGITIGGALWGTPPDFQLHGTPLQGEQALNNFEQEAPWALSGHFGGIALS